MRTFLASREIRTRSKCVEIWFLRCYEEVLDFLVLVLVPTTWGQPISCFKVKVKVKVGAKLNRFRFALERKMPVCLPLVGAGGGRSLKAKKYNGHKNWSRVVSFLNSLFPNSPTM